MASLADLYKQRVVNTSSMPVNVNNNIGMGYRGNLDPSNYKVTTRSGIVPPSIASRDMSVGFLNSPVVDTTGDILNFLTNKIARPSYNTFAQTVNPVIENVAEAFGSDTKNFFPFMGRQDIDFVKDQTTTIPQTQIEQLTADIDKAQEENKKKQTTFDSPLGPITIDQTVADEKAKNEGLLSNSEVKTQSNDGLLSNFTSQPAKEGGYTYNKPVSSDSLLSQNETDTQSTTNQQTKTETKVQEVDNAPVVADPSVEAVATPNNTEVTPTKTFMDKLTNFATSEFGQDFFASLLAQSGPSVGKPQSFGSNLGQAYQKARELQAERDKKTDGSNAISKGIITGNGKSAGLFSDKGKLFAEVDGVKYFEKDFENVFGKNYNFRTFGQQTFGILNGKQMSDLDIALTQDENSLISFVNYLGAVENTNTGVARIADNFIARIKNMVGGELTQEQFDLLLASAELPALIAQSRVELAGPGVLTDQDFIRLLQTIGGDVNAYQNKAVVKDRISDLISKKYATYKRNVDIYNGNVREQFKDLGYKERKLLEFDQDQLNLIDVDAQIKIGVFNPSAYPVDELVSMLNDPSVKSSSKEIIVEYLEGEGQ